MKTVYYKVYENQSIAPPCPENCVCTDNDVVFMVNDKLIKQHYPKISKIKNENLRLILFDVAVDNLLQKFEKENKLT